MIYRLEGQHVISRVLISHNSIVHVQAISLSNAYDKANTPLEALNIMSSRFASENWHYTGGGGIDLHHALLGRDLGGGMAYGGDYSVICEPWWGYGVSGNIMGHITDINGGVFWDIFVFAHEIG